LLSQKAISGDTIVEKAMKDAEMKIRSNLMTKYRKRFLGRREVVNVAWNKVRSTITMTAHKVGNGLI